MFIQNIDSNSWWVSIKYFSLGNLPSEYFLQGSEFVVQGWIVLGYLEYFQTW